METERSGRFASRRQRDPLAFGKARGYSKGAAGKQPFQPPLLLKHFGRIASFGVHVANTLLLQSIKQVGLDLTNSHGQAVKFWPRYPMQAQAADLSMFAWLQSEGPDGMWPIAEMAHQHVCLEITCPRCQLPCFVKGCKSCGIERFGSIGTGFVH